jgi:aerobic-type carbon monoxide dehydrogenase small subunit (CoxS/CutS family)
MQYMTLFRLVFLFAIVVEATTIHTFLFIYLQYKRSKTSNTHNNPGACLVVDDGWRVAVIHGNAQLWLDGIP